jgi:hypothetical protein
VDMIVWYLDLHLPVQSEPIITKVVSLNPAHGEVYSMQHYVIKFVIRYQHEQYDEMSRLTNQTPYGNQNTFSTNLSNSDKYPIIYINTSTKYVNGE